MNRRLRGKSPDEIWDRWQADIEVIRRHLTEMFASRRTFRDLADVFRANPRLMATGGNLWGWMRTNYACTVLVRLRTELDGQPNELCLKALLEELSANAHVATRARIVGRATGDRAFLYEMLNSGFTQRWCNGDDAALSIDPDIPRHDLASLRTLSARVAEVANRTVAHRCQRSPETA